MRIALIGALSLISVVAWSYTVYALRTDGPALTIQLSELADMLAMPYRLARLYAEEPVSALPVPVHGLALSEIADTWNQPRSGGRGHEGVDMFAARGTPVFSSTRGFVVRTGYGELGGNFVFVTGPGGVRYYYAHLDEIAEGIRTGTQVTPDTVLGYVGNTGNAEGTPPHLHFGMYIRGAENPYPLLIDR